MSDLPLNFSPTSSRFRSFCATNKYPNNESGAPRNETDEIAPSLIQKPDTRIDHTFNIPTERSSPNMSLSLTNEGASYTTLKCCCGRPGCAYLEHNNNALGVVERDLETAARLGQVRQVLLHARVCMPSHSVCSSLARPVIRHVKLRSERDH